MEKPSIGMMKVKLTAQAKRRMEQPRSIPAVICFRINPALRRPPGFTLVEIIIALSIAMLIIGVATLSITGLNDENRLRKAATAIEQTARDALMDAVASYQTVTLGLDGSLAAAGDMGGSVQVRRFGEKEFRQPRNGEVWEFSPTGICEPIEIRISGSSGIIELGFDPLTGCARKKNIIVNG